MTALGLVAKVVPLAVMPVLFSALFLMRPRHVVPRRIRAVRAELEPSTKDDFVRQPHDDTLGIAPISTRCPRKLPN